MAITRTSSPQEDLEFISRARRARGAPAGRNDSRLDTDFGPGREDYRAAMDAVLAKYGDEKKFMAALEGGSAAPAGASWIPRQPDVSLEQAALAAPTVESPARPAAPVAGSLASVFAALPVEPSPEQVATLSPAMAQRPAPTLVAAAQPGTVQSPRATAVASGAPGPASSPQPTTVAAADLPPPAKPASGFSIVSSAQAATLNPWETDPIETAAGAPASTAGAPAPWEADPIDTPAERPSLGERFRVNAEQSFAEGTLAGQLVADAKSGEGARMRSDAAFRELDKRRYPADFPSDFEVQPPDAATMSRLPTADRMAITQATDADLERMATEQGATADAARAEFMKQDAARRAEFEAMPGFDRPSEGAAALVGQLAGGSLTPENLVPVGRGATALRTLGEGAAVNAVTSAAVEPAIQRGNIELGRQEGPDPEAALISVALSGLVGGVLNVTPEMTRAIGQRLRGMFGKEKIADITPDELAKAAADPQTIEILKAAGATDEQIAGMSDPTAMAERVRARQEADATAAATDARPLVTGAEAKAAEADAASAARAQAQAVKQAPAELTPDELAAARAAGEQPARAPAPDVIAVGPEVRTGQGAPAATTAAPGAVDLGTEAGIARARGDDIAQRIGEDPVTLVEMQLGIPPETYRGLPADARERVVAAAQRQRAAVEPGPVRATTDAALGEGERGYTPASRPQDGAGEAGRGTKPTDTELDATGRPYARTAAGIADRPTRMDDSSGLDFNDRDPETGQPRDARAAGFEQRANEQARTARAATEEELIREWEARASARPGNGDPDAEARRQYEGGSGKTFSNKAAPQDTEGRYGTDGFGFVRSDKGGPLRFGDQKQAAKWILNVGQRGSPDQIFEIHNHPSGKGFTVRERGRSEAKPGTDGRGQETRNDDGGKTAASAAANEGASRALPARQQPEQAGGQSGGGATEAPAARQDGEAFARNEGGTDDQGLDGSPGNDRGDERTVGGVRRAGSNAPDAATPSDAGIRTGARDADAPTGTADRQGDRPPVNDAGRGGSDRAGADERSVKSSVEGRSSAEAPAPDAARSADAGGADRAGAEGADAGRERPVTLTSGVDPTAVWEKLGKPLTNALKREVASLGKDITRIRALLKSSSSMSAIVQAIGNAAAAVTYSNRGIMHMLRDRYDGPAGEIIGKIADMIGTDPGSGRKVAQTYEEGVNQHAYSRINRMGNIVGPDDLDNRDLAAEVGDVLAGRKGRHSEKARTIAGRLRKMLDETRQYMLDAGVEVGFKADYFPRSLDHTKVAADPVGFEKDAAAVYRKMGLSAEDAKLAAAEWREREMGLGTVQHKLQGVHSDFTKGRTLPPEADTMLAAWYNRDAFEVLSGYFRQSARLAEFTRRFGKSGKDLDAMLAQLGKEGVSEADQWLLRKSIDSSLGLLNGTASSMTTSVTSTIQTIGILRALPRAVWSSVAEPLAYGVRTGNAIDGLKAVANTVAEVFGSKRLDDQREVAEFLGIVGDSMTHMLLAGQFGGGQAGKLNNTILARFFSRSGLQPLTEAQRVAGVKIGQGFIGKLLRDVTQETGYAKSSADLLADLGIDAADAAKLAKWLGKMDGAPKVGDLMGNSAEARMYSAALIRFADESIQNPKAVDRPILANHPVGRLAYGIMSFMYAYTRNVTYRVGNQAWRAATGKGYTAMDRAALALGPGMALAVLAAAQTGVARLRDELTNPDEAKERPPELSIIQYASRAGGFGNLDPIVNGVLGAKYERDLTGLVAGPYVGQYLQDIGKIAGLLPEPIGKNSPNTNTAEWNASRAAYNMVGVPLIAAGLALAPGGPILNKGYGALIASPLGPIGGVSATAPLSPQASSDFATAVAGERPDRWKRGKSSKFKGKFD